MGNVMGVKDRGQVLDEQEGLSTQLLCSQGGGQCPARVLASPGLFHTCAVPPAFLCCWAGRALAALRRDSANGI